MSDREQYGCFYVVREYSHTDKRKLWQVLSRIFSRKKDANDWADFLREGEYKKKKGRIFVVEEQR